MRPAQRKEASSLSEVISRYNATALLEATMSQEKGGSSGRVPIAGQELFRTCYEEMDPGRSEVAGLAAPDEFAYALVIDALA